MKTILKSEAAHKIHKGDFNIDINFPGLALSDRTDKRGLAQLGRFDRGRLKPGVFVAMHPHVNDEILSYIRKGVLVHEDTEGEKTSISPSRLMMMNAGRGIYHQESIPKDGQEVEMLQIFMRPSKPGLQPEVQFLDLKDAYSYNQWRKIAGPEFQSGLLRVNSEVSVFDARITENLEVPFKAEKIYLLYVFQGAIQVDADLLTMGDSLIYDEGALQVQPLEETDLVLFELDRNATFTRDGMYSGV